MNNLNLKKTYLGSIAIFGRPNVGKSTLLNKLLGKKITITTSKPHTTHYPIIGVHTNNCYQTIYIDTPGIYKNKNRLIDKLINKSTMKVIKNVDALIMVIEGITWTKEDDMVIKLLKNFNGIIIIAINKIDKILNKNFLLKHIKFVNKKINFHSIIPVCAKTGLNIYNLLNVIKKLLPSSNRYFFNNYNTYQSKSFMASEAIRETLIRFLGNELPYSIAVKIDNFTYIKNDNKYYIYGLIFVERNGQKKIIIGKKGIKIKNIGIHARKNIESILNIKIYLKLWVLVKPGWVENKYILHSLGYISSI